MNIRNFIINVLGGTFGASSLLKIMFIFVLSFQKCCYCSSWVPDEENDGACIQCSSGRCTTAFHTTCAQVNKVPFKPCDWPQLIIITCSRHLAGHRPNKVRDLLKGFTGF